VSVISGQQFWSLFEGFRHSAWRWEAQPAYLIADEQADLARFLADEPEPPNHNADWHDQIRAWAAVGKTVSRVRVLTAPLTDYQRYQVAWGIPGNVTAGEQVRILDPAAVTEPIAPQQDFWIFDDATVVHLNFDPEGRLIDRHLIDEPDLDQYARWREAAIRVSLSWRDWVDART
jgi:hypothetical protein